MISYNSIGCAVVDSLGQVQPLLAGLDCHQVQGFIDQLLQAERLMLQLYLVVLSAGEVQYVVDYGQESFAAVPDTFDVFCLLQREVIIQEKA